MQIILEETKIGSALPTRAYNVIAEALKELPKKGWLLLEFGLLSKFNKLVVFSLLPKGEVELVVFQDIDIESLQTICDDFSRAAGQIAIGDDWSGLNLLEEASRELYTHFFSGSVEALIKTLSPETLIIVPHKFLHLVGFQILNDGTTFLTDNHAVATAFSLDVLRILVAKAAKMNHWTKYHLSLIMFDPTDANLRDEITTVNQTLSSISNITTLEEADLQKTQVIKTLQDKSWSLIHFVGHGHYAEPASASALKLRDSFLTAAEIQSISLSGAPLVVINACSSGRVEPRAGDELVGLGRSFVMAGATTVVATHWPVHPETTREFSHHFYHELVKGKSFGSAFASAINKMRKSVPEWLKWGAFSLLGNPFAKLMV